MTNRYYVSLDVGFEIEAHNKQEAEQQAYNQISNIDYLDDYTIIGEPRLIDTEIENICMSCNKRDVGGSNDSMCPKCFAEWNRRYEERKKERS